MMSFRLGILMVIVVAVGVTGCTASTSTNGASPSQPSAIAAETPRSCDSSPVPLEREDVRAVAFARGDGPVFVGLGTADVVRHTVDTKAHKGWYYYKTLWAIAPKYRGAVTVTGFQLDGEQELRFNPSAGFPGEKATELVFEPSDEDGWRYGPSDTLIRADGCYTFRVEGDDFVEWVTFIARS